MIFGAQDSNGMPSHFPERPAPGCYGELSGAGVGVGRLRGTGVLSFLVSRLFGLLASWFLGFLVSKFRSSKDSKNLQCF